MKRSTKVLLLGMLGIAVNIFLFIIKFLLGMVTKSIVIITDAINNFTDIFSAIISIIGNYLANKKPDKEHPYGHGRIEYFSAILISFMILSVGVIAIIESLKKVINPVIPSYSIISIIIIVIGIIVKLGYGIYIKNEGNKLNCSNLIATGIDSLSDAILSFSTLISVIVSMLFKINIEGYLGMLIGLFIIKSAYEIIKSTLNELIGGNIDEDIINNLKEDILGFDDVLGISDLMVHSYGPSKFIATAKINVDDHKNASEIDKLTRKISLYILKKYKIELTLGIYAINNKNKYLFLRRYLNKLIKNYSNIISYHGFYVNEKSKNVSFDIVFKYEEKNQKTIIKEIKNKMKEKYPNYSFSIIYDNELNN